jgi:hypothetical protein
MTIWDNLHKFGFGQVDQPVNRNLFDTYNTRLQYQKFIQYYISDGLKLQRGINFSATGFREGIKLDQIISIYKPVKKNQIQE